MHLLDTCIVIQVLRGNSFYQERLSQLRPQDTGICHHVYYELMVGIEKARLSQQGKVVRKKEKALAQLLGYLACHSFTSECAREAAQIRANLEDDGNSIGAIDLLIAGTARKLDLTLITDNISEFQRVSGLKLEQWQA